MCANPQKNVPHLPSKSSKKGVIVSPQKKVLTKAHWHFSSFFGGFNETMDELVDSLSTSANWTEHFPERSCYFQKIFDF